MKAAVVGLTFLSTVYYLGRLLLMLYLIFSTVNFRENLQDVLDAEV